MILFPSLALSLFPSPGHQVSPQSLSLHQAAPHVHCGCGGVAASAGDVVSEGRGVSAGRERGGMQPSAGLLPQQRGITLVFQFYLCTYVCVKQGDIAKFLLERFKGCHQNRSIKLYLWICTIYPLLHCQSSSGSDGEDI